MNAIRRLHVVVVCTALACVGLACERRTHTDAGEPSAAEGAPDRVLAEMPKLLENLGDQHHPVTADSALGLREQDRADESSWAEEGFRNA